MMMYSRMEIYYLRLRVLVQQMGKKQDNEALLADNQNTQAVQPSLGAMEVDVKTWQLDTFLVKYVVGVLPLVIHLVFFFSIKLISLFSHCDFLHFSLI